MADVTGAYRSIGVGALSTHLDLDISVVGGTEVIDLDIYSSSSLPPGLPFQTGRLISLETGIIGSPSHGNALRRMH